MACNCSDYPCSCNTANCPDCSCADPGSVDYGRYLPVLDYAFCDKRLATPDSSSVLVATLSQSGQATIKWSTTLALSPDQVEVVEGTRIPFLTAFMGASDSTVQYLKAIYPADAANGFIRAVDGEWVVSDIDAATIPDPLTVSTINATTLGAFNNITIGGTLTFTNSVPTGTIDTSIGLDSTGKVVKETSGSGGGGGLPQYAVAKAVYYELANEGSYTPNPNEHLANNAYATIGNELIDHDSICSVTNSTTLTLDVDGWYEIQWQAYSRHDNNDSGLRNLWLEINGVTSIPGTFPSGHSQSSSEDYTIIGTTVMQLNAGDTLRIMATGNNTYNIFYGIKIVVTRFQGA